MFLLNIIYKIIFQEEKANNDDKDDSFTPRRNSLMQRLPSRRESQVNNKEMTSPLLESST